MTHTRIAPRFRSSFSAKAPRFQGIFGRFAALTLGLSALATGSQAQDYTYSTFAGIAGKQGNVNGTGGNPLVPIFSFPIGVAVNPAGNIYVADSGNSLLRLVTPAGVVTTFVGTASKAGGNDGTTSDPNVTFNLPQGPVVDSSGNLYVADYNGHTIRKITPTGTVTTIAGTAATSGSTDATGSAARFLNPSGLALDSSGNLYVADSGNHVIRKITSAGVVTTLAGTAGSSGTADGKGAVARFLNPRGIASDATGNLYVADTGNNTIRKVAPDGTVTTFAGASGTFGATDGSGTTARFNFPNSLALDQAGNLYVADQANNAIRKITSAGVVSTLAGQAGSEGRLDGTGSAARFNRPTGVAVDASGNLYVADYLNQLIRKVTSAGVVTTVAGAGGFSGMQNGTGYIMDPVLFRNPTSAVVDGAGTVYVSDSANNSIRKITAAGTTSLFVGSSSGLSGTADGQGSTARFNTPSGLTIDATGNLFVADSTNHTIRKVTPAGDVTLYAGVLSTFGSLNGSRTTATFESPSGVAVDAAGNVYVADYGNHLIRVISLSGTVSTLAGTAGSPGSTDGVGTSARFTYPRDVAVDGSGNVYVADYGNHVIRKITPGGLVQTLAGSAGNAGSSDGSGSSARFNGPAGLTVDASGNLFVSDANNSTIRKVTPAGVVTTVGGTAGSIGTDDGVGAAARFNFPTDVAVDASGNLYVVDNRNHTIRKGSLPGSGGSGGSGGGSGGSGGGSGGSGGSSGVDDSAAGSGFLLQPVGLTSDSLGNYYVCDTANHCIKKIASGGVISVLAGKSGSSGTADGTGESARFNRPTGITIDTGGSIVVTDTGNSTIRKITSAGVVTTYAGTAGTSGTTDATGTAALFSQPTGIAVNTSTGDLYVSDSANSTIRKISTTGVVTTMAGTARSVGDADGVAAAARFNNPTGLTVDGFGNLLVADTFNHTIRRITISLRIVSTTAVGTIGTEGTALVVLTDAGLTGSPITLNVAVTAGDDASTWAGKVVTALLANTAVAARYTVTNNVGVITLTYLSGVDDSSAANLSLSNGSCTGITASAASTSTSPMASVSTIAGSAGISGAYDGNGQFALFNLPQGISANSSTGQVFIADTGNSCIRRIALGGTVTTTAGIAGISGKRSGAGEQALFNQPQALLNLGSALLVADTGNSLLRFVNLTTIGSSVSTAALSTATTTDTSGGSSGGSTSSGGGGGAPSYWFLAFIGVAAILRRFTHNRG